MKVIVFGATGMVGQGVLRECLLATDVEVVLAVGRTPVTAAHPKLRQLVRTDLFDYADARDQWRGYDACLFCMGVSVSDTDEAGYIRLNHDLPLAAARALVAINPDMTFIYVSGAGTDSTAQGPVLWARVKGRTENELLGLGFRAVYLLRPGVIAPINGEVSKTRVYRLFYAALGWALAPLRRLFPVAILDTERVGRAMLELARRGTTAPVVEAAGIDRLGRASPPAR